MYYLFDKEYLFLGMPFLIQMVSPYIKCPLPYDTGFFSPIMFSCFPWNPVFNSYRLVAIPIESLSGNHLHCFKVFLTSEWLGIYIKHKKPQVIPYLSFMNRINYALTSDNCERYKLPDVIREFLFTDVVDSVKSLIDSIKANESVKDYIKKIAAKMLGSYGEEILKAKITRAVYYTNPPIKVERCNFLPAVFSISYPHYRLSIGLKCVV